MNKGVVVTMAVFAVMVILLVAWRVQISISCERRRKFLGKIDFFINFTTEDSEEQCSLLYQIEKEMKTRGLNCRIGSPGGKLGWQIILCGTCYRHRDSGTTIYAMTASDTAGNTISHKFTGSAEGLMATEVVEYLLTRIGRGELPILSS